MIELEKKPVSVKVKAYVYTPDIPESSVDYMNYPQVLELTLSQFNLIRLLHMASAVESTPDP